MRSYSRGFAAPGAVIFLAVIGFVAWYRNHNDLPQASTTPAAEMRIAGEGKTSSVR